MFANLALELPRGSTIGRSSLSLLRSETPWPILFWSFSGANGLSLLLPSDNDQARTCADLTAGAVHSSETLFKLGCADLRDSHRAPERTTRTRSLDHGEFVKKYVNSLIKWVDVERC